MAMGHAPLATFFMLLQCLFLLPSAVALVSSATFKANGAASVSVAKSQAQFRRGHVSDLHQDALFQMAWAQEDKLHSQSQVAHVAEENCSSFVGDAGFSCYIESPEHTLLRKWIPANATVMEFGARFGTTTCELAKKLGNSGQLVTVEPDHNVWGWLEHNLKSHNCQAHVLRGAVSGSALKMLGSGYGGRSQVGAQESWSGMLNDLGSRLSGHTTTVPVFTFEEVEKAAGLKVDTLLIDCEGCAQDMMDQIGPKIQHQIQTIVIEADMPDTGGDCTSHCMNYKKFFDFLSENGFQQVDKFNDCDRSRSGAPDGTWCGKWIEHYAFKRFQL